MPNLFQETVESPNPQALRIFLELLALKGSVLASKRRLFASKKRLFVNSPIIVAGPLRNMKYKLI